MPSMIGTLLARVLKKSRQGVESVRTDTYRVNPVAWSPIIFRTEGA